MTRHYHPAHRRQAIQWARGLMARGFLVLDTETTGLGTADQIVEIAIIDQAGHTRIHQRIKPSISIPPAASRIHGISDADIVDAPTFRQLYIKLSALLAGEVVVAYNMDFDWRLLLQTASVYKLPEPRVAKRDCAMKQYARYKGERNPKGRHYRPHKLTAAVHREGLSASGAHSSLGDARMTLALLGKMAEAT
ncbi:MAG: 3'-5' exonuclease [Chloroflexi bacterium]|nr:3'-5' exonuclease [Chloroflexota bacterium]MCY4247604.1 3'-5' exonuclease [Chloroflexota bacterium]